MQFEQIFIHDQEIPLHETLDFLSYRIGIFANKNKSGESGQNEDVLFANYANDTLRIGVTDGAGGHPRGRDAAFLVGEEMLKIDNQAVFQKIEIANQKILDMKAGSRATLALAQIKNDVVTFHSVGDSEIVYWNAQGRMLYSSVPHSPAGFKVEAGVTTQSESLTDPDRHIVMSLMGDEFVQIQSTTSQQLKKGHTFLIGSDGVFDNIPHETLAAIVAKGSFEQSFQELVEICTKQDEKTWLKDDDIAFTLVRKVRS